MFPLNATFVEGRYTVIPLEKYKEILDKADFVLTQEGGHLTYDEPTWLKDSINSLIKTFEDKRCEFSLLKEFDVDIDEEGVRFLIYRRMGAEVTLGSLSEPQGEGVMIKAVDFVRGNLAYSPEFGLLIDGGVSPAYVIYDVNLPYDGNYELWVRYATQEARPVDIYFDGVLKKSEALTKFTRGWGYFDTRWFREVEIEAKKGRHSLKFIAQKTFFPHIDSIKFVYTPKGNR